MVIRKVIIDNWRALTHVEHALAEGWNLLQGPNEAGKSTTVEAIEWALYRDLVGTRTAARETKSEIESIIPAHDPNARPVVTLDLEFSNCAATITKTLAPDAAKRECRLVIRQPGGADQHCDQAEAQQKLKALIAADGLGDSKDAAFDAALLISHQGEAAHYVEAEISPAVRSTLTVNENGTIAPTSRLQKVGARVEKLRADELFENLRQLATDAARRQSVAAHLRLELEELRRQRADLSFIENAIEELRDAIAALLHEIEELRPRGVQAREQWETLRHRHTAQLTANQIVSAHELEYHTAENARQNLRRRIGEVQRLRAEQEQGQRQLMALQAEQAAAIQLQSAVAEQLQAAGVQWQQAEAQWQAARQQVDAWQQWWDVYTTYRELKDVRKRLQSLELLAQEVAQAQSHLNSLPLGPAREQIRNWREQWNELTHLSQEAAQQLQINIVLEQPLTLEWFSDEQAEQQAIEPGVPLRLQVGKTVTLVLPGIGRIEARCTGQELQKLAQEMAQRKQALNEELMPFNFTVLNLPAAFDNLETQVHQVEAATAALKAAEAQFQNETALDGSVAEAEQQEKTARTAWEAAKASCEPVLKLLPPNLTREQVQAALEPAKANEQPLREQAEQARRDHDALLNDSHAENLRVASLNEQAKAIDVALCQIAERLTELATDELDQVQQAQQLEQLDKAAWHAEMKLEEVQGKRAALGKAITDDMIETAEREHNSLLQQLQTRETTLVQLRRDLWNRCEDDPKTKMAEIEASIEPKAAELERHEARLRGIVLLEAVLEAERHRLGRMLSEPLNKLLSPWLTQIRGKATYVEFDDNGQRITNVRTTDGAATISLPFEAHSEGMKEQTALAMRLILAQEASRRLPSKCLPVILDDPLTQTDATRRAGLYRVLHEAAQNLQVIFVTCHEPPGTNSEPNEQVVTIGKLKASSKNGKNGRAHGRNANGDTGNEQELAGEVVKTVRSRKATPRKTTTTNQPADELSLF